MINEFLLNNGMKVPAVGYGTYLSTANDGETVLKSALEAGYRFFDTASFYKNEEVLGTVLTSSGIARNELQIASKMWRTEMGYEQTKKACNDSLQRLKTEYLDVYLIHWPKQDNYGDDWKEILKETWRAMEEL